MSSIIVLDSSDEETDSANKKPRIGPPARSNQPPVQSMARVNPVKLAANKNSAKKTSVLPVDNFKIHLPTKRCPPNESTNDPPVPEKRIRRIKPTTVVRSNDEEWINRQKNGEQTRANPAAPMLNKSFVQTVKNPIRIVKSPTTTSSPTRSVPSPGRVVVSPAPGSNAKGSLNYVRVAWNGMDPSSAVINKNITAYVKEQPQASVSPPVINKSITATIKDQSKVVSLSPPLFNKNSVTIRRVLVNEEKPKTPPIPTKLQNSATASKTDQSKGSSSNTNATSIRRVPMSTDSLKTTLQPTAVNKGVNNSAVKIAPVTNTTSMSIKRTTPSVEAAKVSQFLPVLKRNQSVNKSSLCNDPPTTAVTSAPSALCANTATIKRIVTVDLPKTPASPPVITKNYNIVTKRSVNEQPKSSMSLSVVMKNHSPVLPTDEQVPASVLSKPKTLASRPSGLIVTPVTSAVPTTTAPTQLNTSKLGRCETIVSRITPKQVKQAGSRAKASSLSNEQQSIAPMHTSMFNMCTPNGNFMGGPPMMYDIDPTGGTFVNPAYMRAIESTNFPTITTPAYSMNYPSFSGGSITPVISPGPAPSPTYNTGRSSKSPVTSTITRSSGSNKGTTGFLGMTIDVDQPPSMSPPVFNMNNSAFNGGDPFNFLRGSHTIPSPAYSPVRCTKSPSTSTANKGGLCITDTGPLLTNPPSPIFHRDLDNFVRNPLSYPKAASNATMNSSSAGNGPICVESPVRNHPPDASPGHFKSPTSTITSPAHSTISEGSSLSELFNHSLNGNEKNNKSAQDIPNLTQQGDPKIAETNDKSDEVEKEPLSLEYETLLKACREADSSEDMNRLIDSKLIRYYYSVHPDFARSRGFRKAVVAATESIKKDPDLVYYHLRPVVEEMKARKKSKAIVMTNDETSAAAAAAADEGIEDKVRNRQIRRLNKGLYILTRKIHKLENQEVDLDDENSSYLMVERYKKRACEIYDKICDLTGESKHALRQVKKPITFKATEYPKFNKVVETFVNRTKEFPDFFDVLRMLEFCNERYNFNLLKEEMTMIAQDAFIKIGKLLQSRRKADLYETVSHFTSDYEDPAANDPALLAKLSENEKNQTSIGSIIDKFAREQLKRKAESAAESANASGDELNNTSNGCNTDESRDEEGKTKTNNKSVEKPEDENKVPLATTNGTRSPPSPHIISSSSPSPAASTSAAFRISPPHAFASPQASPRARSASPLQMPDTISLETQPFDSSPQLQLPQLQPSQSWATNSLKILSVTSLNDSASTCKDVSLALDKQVVTSVDEIVISDEDL